MTAPTLTLLMPAMAVVGTVSAFLVGSRLQRLSGGISWMHPVLLAVALVGASLLLTDIPYDDYFTAVMPLHWLLGPMVVMLAIPLFRQLPRIKCAALAIATVLHVGCIVAIVTATIGAVASGAPEELTKTLLPKSVTAGVAIGIAERIGGIPGIAATVVILTSLTAVAIAPPLFALAGIRDERAQGIALGIAAHGIGTARAFQISETAGAFSTIGMILNALITCAIVAMVF